jgi:apolipoprotein N-acyltransferase
VLKAPGLPPIGAVICFESTYPRLTREFVRNGAEIIVVTTNNATFERSPLARQHLAQSQMRAVETGRPVLHAAISGISAVIAPDGRIVQSAGLFIPAILRQTVDAATGKTPYVAYGDATEGAFGGGAALAAVVAMLLAARRRVPGFAFDDDEDEFWGTARPPDEPVAGRLREDDAEEAAG